MGLRGCGRRLLRAFAAAGQLIHFVELLSFPFLPRIISYIYLTPIRRTHAAAETHQPRGESQIATAWTKHT